MQRLRRFESPINMFLADSAKSDTPVDASCKSHLIDHKRKEIFLVFDGPKAIQNPEKYNDYLRLFQLN